MKVLECDGRVDVIEEERPIGRGQPINEDCAVGHVRADEHSVGGANRLLGIWHVIVEDEVAILGVAQVAVAAVPLDVTLEEGDLPAAGSQLTAQAAKWNSVPVAPR